MTTTTDMKSRNLGANVTRDLMLPPLDSDHAGGMGLGILIRESLDSLLANKGRALLTMLGVIIGVASVVALMALGNGASREITGQVESIGTNLIFIMPSAPSRDMRLRGQAMMQGTTPQTLTVDDAKAIEGLGLPLNGVASTFNGSGEMVAPAASVFAQITGVNASDFSLNSWQPRRERSSRTSRIAPASRSWCWAPTSRRTCSATARPPARRFALRTRC